ncbi:MAG: energy-coupling factor transporter transmembrane protein EcfT [Proteobacteria bacterium]|nr:energy-coupling factor transporter transmembrane protein EcfT [Pseudomonadota bacterium]
MSFFSIPLGQYYPAQSVIHNLDPRFKILALAALMLLTFSVSAPVAVILHTAALLGCVTASSIPLRVFARGLKIFFFLFLFTAVLHLFFTPGTAILRLPGPVPLKITHEGLVRGALISWRLLGVIALSFLLTFTTTPLRVTRGIEALLAPLGKFRFPVQDFSLMMMIAIRFIPVLATETDRVWKAQRSRGADLRKGGVKARARTLLSVLYPVFSGLFRRADELAIALEARGYVPGKPRTSMCPLRWGRGDGIALLVILFWVGGIFLAGRVV